MAALTTPRANIGWSASPFSLRGTDGKMYTLAEVRGKNGLLVMFICNHCPFVKAVLDKIIRDAAGLRQHGIGSVAIMPNDVVGYPDDAFDNMKRLAEEKHFPFPYLIDETQQVAKAYGAVCTPDFFGFNASLQLQYRGRLDATSPSNPAVGTHRELFDAMIKVVQTGSGPDLQHSSIGCSIKWKSA